jgi:hypothetical protein
LDEPRQSPRYARGQDTASGYGIVRFNKEERLVQVEAHRFLGDVEDPGAENQFPGWPHTIHQLENGGQKVVGFLPQLQIEGMRDPVVKVTHEATGRLEYMIRIQGDTFSPPIYRQGRFEVEIGEPETGIWKTLKGLIPAQKGNSDGITIEF